MLGMRRRWSGCVHPWPRAEREELPQYRQTAQLSSALLCWLTAEVTGWRASLLKMACSTFMVIALTRAFWKPSRVHKKKKTRTSCHYVSGKLLNLRRLAAYYVSQLCVFKSLDQICQCKFCQQVQCVLFIMKRSLFSAAETQRRDLALYKKTNKNLLGFLCFRTLQRCLIDLS